MLGKHPEDPFRPKTYKNNNLTWNGKRLTSYGTNTYKYNSEGIRISKTTSEGEYKYLLDGNKIIKEIKPNNKEIYYHYDEKEELVGFNYNTKEYFYIRDITGNITNIIDSNGTIKVSYEYDAWGKVINIDGDEDLIEINSYLYKGYYYDKETSLYYCNSRYYDLEIRRWISIDDADYLDSETVNGVNLCAYCMNNPVMCSDPSGHLPKWAKWLIGGVVIATLAIATIATGGAAGGVAGFVLAGALKGAVVGAVSGALVNGTISGISSAIDGESFWSGFAEGAANGFMSGAIIGGITGAISSGLQVAKAASYWDKGTFSSGYKSMKYHYTQEVVNKGLTKGNSIVKYTNDAVKFANNNGMNFTLNLSRNGLQNSWSLDKYFGSGANGLYTSSGNIITFHYFYVW